MGLRETLTQILSEYSTAKTALLGGHPLAQFIRGQAAVAVADALGSEADGLIVQASPGQGNWAAVPWISIFDPAITTSATRGYYVVYLFHATKKIVHLSLNQGTTAIREEFGARARGVHIDRAEFMRKRVSEFQKTLPAVSIELGSDARLPGDYAAGHAMGVTYPSTRYQTKIPCRRTFAMLSTHIAHVPFVVVSKGTPSRNLIY
jgi:5-methylcytosine-specific restriction protein A